MKIKFFKKYKEKTDKLQKEKLDKLRKEFEKTYNIIRVNRMINEAERLIYELDRKKIILDAKLELLEQIKASV